MIPARRVFAHSFLVQEQDFIGQYNYHQLYNERASGSTKDLCVMTFLRTIISAELVVSDEEEVLNAHYNIPRKH